MCFVTALSLAMEHGCSNTKLHLKINVRFSKTVKVENIPSNSKRNRGAKICSIQSLRPKENPIPTPPVSFITHTMHFTHYQSLIPVLILLRAALHATDQVLRRDLASHIISPLTNLFSLEQPCDLARSHPIGLQKKFVSTPWTNRTFQCGFSASYIFICGVGCLSQGKEGQREK